MSAIDPAQASAPDTAALNSDSIRRRFGSYGVEVLASDARLRVTRLYSYGAEVERTHTLARVAFASPLPEVLSPEHAAVLEGGSIGEVFRSAGWSIVKRHRYLGLRALAGVPVLARYLGHAVGDFALHGYDFDVQRDGRLLHYAEILELHAPDYIGIETLFEQVQPITDPWPESRIDAALASLA